MIILVLHHSRKVTLFSVTLIKKANILNSQFTSVFADDTKTSLSDLGSSPYPSMDVTVSCDGVVKLLKNLKPHKVARPDSIPLMLPKEAAN